MITCPVWNTHLITTNGRSTRDHILHIARFLRLSLVEIGFPPTVLIIIFSINAKETVPKYLLFRKTPLHFRQILI